MTRPFIVTHDEDVCREEGRRIETDEVYAENWQGECTYRYLVWADSHLDAARQVQAHKKRYGRILPEKYNVFGLKEQPHGSVHTLGDGSCSDDDAVDLERLEGMFGVHREVKL